MRAGCHDEGFTWQELRGVLVGAVLAFFNQGEVCTCPSRALIQEIIYDEFMQRVVERTRAIRRGNPLDTDTQIGAQASLEHYEQTKNLLVSYDTNPLGFF